VNERIRRLDESVGRNGATPLSPRISPTSGLPMARLHLLPSAPDALVEHVYAHIVASLQEAGIGPANLRRHKVALRQEREAIEGARANLGPANSDVRYPWISLHIDADAPAGILHIAYEYWHTMLERQRRPSIARSVAIFGSRLNTAAATARNRVRFTMPGLPAIHRLRMPRWRRPAPHH
jgi:hypothetical protein